MFSRWTVTNITSASVTTFLAFLAGIISRSVYCTTPPTMQKLTSVAVSTLGHNCTCNAYSEVTYVHRGFLAWRFVLRFER
jgi:hypothetical protein